ncbi:cytochrome P450 [Mycena alexandri]|uniref:Cytochrome P450 n=1 Tax=Mycena alexandri TaxID=1745969 RepID=A0AAD6S5H9_9AGAR|nr:cytochrome P450 [Mycena alexandri]
MLPGLASYGMDHATIFAIAGLGVAIYYSLQRRSNPSLRNIPGPPSSSWTFGNMLQLLLPPQYGDYEFTWLKKFGPVYLVKGCFGQNRLLISDPLALQHILNGPHFGHGPTAETVMDLILDQNAVVAAKGETHKRLRAALNIAFTSSAVRNYQPIFERVAEQITERLDKCSGSITDLYPILSHGALSTISEAVLGCSTRDLGEAFVTNNQRVIILSSSQSSTRIIVQAIGSRLPKMIRVAAMHLPTTTFKVLRSVKSLAHQIGKRVIAEKLGAVQQGANMRTDVFGMLLDPEQSDLKKNLLTEEELVAQTGILMIAGQDTVTNTLVFGFLELARHPEFQHQLRAEIHASLRGPSRTSSYESMPLLNAFIKETLRLYPPGALQERIAVQDTVIPLTEGIKNSAGELINHIQIQKGQVVLVAIASYQRLQSRWGEDSHQFKPSRWIDGTIVQGQAVGPYANLLSFLGGPRVCLGWRFAILELQVFFSELVGGFSFALPEEDGLRTRFANMLILVTPSGEKAAPLHITRI